MLGVKYKCIRKILHSYSTHLAFEMNEFLSNFTIE